MRICTECKAEVSTNFKRLQCSEECRKARQRRYYHENKDRMKANQAAYYERRGGRQKVRPEVQRRWRLKKHYGLTPEEYDSMLDRQQGLCAICSSEMEQPNIDHNHETGAVRDLLCLGCNLAIGHLKDDPDRAMALALYLERHVG